MHNKPDDRWTRDELTLKCGPKELAIAVIKQWHEDGEPKADRPAIEYWFKVIEEYNKENTNANQTGGIAKASRLSVL